MSEFWRKLSGWLRRDQLDAELREEIQTHLEMKEASTGDRDAARRGLGNVALLMEDSRAVWGWPGIESWIRDLRYALRVVARDPGFAATVVLTLAVGIGASSTVFSLIDAVLLRPLAYPESERLVAIHEAKLSDRLAVTGIAPGRLEDWQRLATGFEAIAGSYQDTLTDTTGATPERLSAGYVSPGFFSAMGTPPSLGRVFTPEEERSGGPQAAVLSDALWRRRFAADPAVLGRSLVLAEQSYVIVGVMPRAFQYPAPDVELWLAKQARPGLMRIREARFYNGVGRLKPGVTLPQAQANLAAVQRKLGEQYPKTDSGWSVALEPLKDRLVGSVRLALWLLFGSVSILLLIACANVACLLLARLNSRGAEIATRCALGAGSAAIARQLFAEGLAYALAGGALGMAAAFGAISLLRKQLPDMPRIAELSVDVRTLGLVAAVSILSVVLFSLAPILQTFRQELAGALVRGGRGLVGSRQRLPRLLVSAQLALATALLIGAGLLLRSLIGLQEAPLGFRTDNVLTMRVGASFNEDSSAAMDRHRRTMDALSSLPGVTAVSMASGLPGVNPTWPREFEIAGEPASDGALRFASWRVVTTGYFQTLGIPILAGRSCRMNTGTETPFEILVNRSFADRYLQGRDPIGRSILQGPIGNTSMKIVGVVADAREDGPGTERQPLAYACGFLRYWPDSDFLIQTRNPAALANAARQTMQRLEPLRPVYSVRPLGDALRGALSQARFRTLVIGLFSIMALLLSAVGLYSVMAYMVTQRTREIGIRMALGARPGQIFGEILRSAGVLVGAGGAAGIALGAVSSRAMGALLYGTGPTDLSAFASAAGVLAGAALLACLIPGRRAVSIDPMAALREQ